MQVNLLEHASQGDAKAGQLEAEKHFGPRNSGVEGMDQGGDRGRSKQGEDRGGLKVTLRMCLGNPMESELAQVVLGEERRFGVGGVRGVK